MSPRPRFVSFPSLAFVVVAAACTDGLAPEGSVPLVSPVAAEADVGSASANPALPMAGRCTARVVGTPTVVPPYLYQTSVGTCDFTHLGRAALRTDATIHMPTNTQTADITYTAANGDQLFARNVGVLSPADGTFSGTTAILDGTGRFAGASGALTSTGRLGPSAEIEHDGWIRYSAAAKSGR